MPFGPILLEAEAEALNELPIPAWGSASSPSDS